MKVIIKKDYEQVSQEAFAMMKDLIQQKPNVTLGLATGSTPIGLYNNMVADHQKNHTSYASAKSFNLDEYVGIERDHPQSYWTFMHEHLFQQIDMLASNIHVPFGKTAADCEAYEKSIKQEVIDLQILGIGGNGHIGFNEPNTSFQEETHIETLSQKTRDDNARFFDNDIQNVPTHAITMGIATIMRARKILLIASGANKADAIFKMIQGDVQEACPASILQKHSDVVVILDEAAASKLK